MSLMTLILNGEILELSKMAYCVVEVGIIGMIFWFGPTGLVIQANGFNWVNACMLYVFAGFFGIHGWPFRQVVTWILFLCILGIDGLLMTIDI
jgi:hypothetical protein